MTINHRQKPKTWYFVDLILLNLICLIHSVELLRGVLLSFSVKALGIGLCFLDCSVPPVRYCYHDVL